MSWSAIIIVNSVCDTYTSVATRLRFDLYTFWDIFGWFWLWSFCVQQFWACKFTVSLCFLLLVRRNEAKSVETKRGEVTSRRIFLGHLVAESVYIKFYYMDMEMEQMFVRIVEWGVGLADDQTAVCRVCRRIYNRSSLPYQGTVLYWLITAFRDGQVVVCGIIVLYCAN